MIPEVVLEQFLEPVKEHILNRNPPLTLDKKLQLLEAITEVALENPGCGQTGSIPLAEGMSLIIGEAEKRLGWSKTQ